MGLVHIQHQVASIPAHNVPSVAVQLVLHSVDEIRGTIQTDRLVSAQQQAQQAIEISKVVHVGVADKGMADTHELPCW